MNSGFQAGSSSIVDLKAEVLRKKEEAKRNRVRLRERESLPGSKIKKKFLESKVEERKKEEEEEDNDSSSGRCSRVAESLRKKAALYDHLRSGKKDEEEDGLRSRFLVDFGDSEDRDLVEYTDPLGRTRMVTREESKAMRDEEPEWCGERDSRTKLSNKESELDDEARRDILREKWAKEEEENLRKRDIHYGDVLFDEARSHGAGYYGFSRDETTRQREKDTLNELHRETKESQIQSEEKKKKRNRLMAAYLKRVREDKRLHMGLPLKPVGQEDQSEDSDVDNDKREEEDEEKKMERSISENIKKMREKQETEKRRNKFVREWDIGKEERYVMNQSEWVSVKRDERPSEFAPSYRSKYEGNKSDNIPQGYSSTKQSFSKTQKNQNKVSRSSRPHYDNNETTTFRRKKAEIPPPKFEEAPSTSFSQFHCKESFLIGQKKKKKARRWLLILVRRNFVSLKWPTFSQ